MGFTNFHFLELQIPKKLIWKIKAKNQNNESTFGTLSSISYQVEQFPIDPRNFQIFPISLKSAIIRLFSSTTSTGKYVKSATSAISICPSSFLRQNWSNREERLRFKGKLETDYRRWIRWTYWMSMVLVESAANKSTILPLWSNNIVCSLSAMKRIGAWQRAVLIKIRNSSCFVYLLATTVVLVCHVIGYWRPQRRLSKTNSRKIVKTGNFPRFSFHSADSYVLFSLQTDSNLFLDDYRIYLCRAKIFLTSSYDWLLLPHFR